MLDVDVETTGLQPWSGKQYAFMYIFGDGQTVETIRIDEPNWRPRVQAWLDRAIDDPEGIRAWNTKFDKAWLDQAGFNIPGDGKWHDAMVVAHAVDERRSIALKSVAKELFGADAADPQTAIKTWLTEERRRRKSESLKDSTELVEPTYEDVPDELMRPYAHEDVVLTRKISDVYAQTLAAAPDLQRVVDFEREVMDALYAVEKRGLPARQDEYRLLELEVVENLERLEKRVRDLAMKGDPKVFNRALKKDGWKDIQQSEDGSHVFYPDSTMSLDEFNPRSSPQVIAALKARGADLSFMSEKGGNLSADVENLTVVDDPLAQAILDFRSEEKVLGTYVRPMLGRTYSSAMRMWKEPFLGDDGRIHANYRQVGTITGRMSCSDPNMQNQPRDDLRLRYNIVADPGHSLVACDLSNIEMVLFAAYAGEGLLLKTVREGGDLHTLTAKMLDITDRKRPGGYIETARQRGKTFNFSIIYGGGIRTIRKQQRCDRNEANRMKERYYAAYPEVGVLQARIEARLMDDGYISDKLISGRRFRVDWKEAYKAVNYLVQGTAAALLKEALIKLHKDGVPVVALVHDEIVAHVPIEDAQEVKNLIIQRMTENEQLRAVVGDGLKAEGEVIQRWSEAKNPQFKPRWAQELIAA